MNVLDTGIVIDMLKERNYHSGAISPLTLIETLRGIDSKKRVKIKNLLEESFAVLNLDNKVIEAYCDLYSKLKKGGTPLPDADLLIAATAVAYDLTLETKDEHFQRLTYFGLKIK
jgi:predicted nucleic acid-binding protein